MTVPANIAPTECKLTRLYSAPSEVVYEAWTNREFMQKWMNYGRDETVQIQEWNPQVGTAFKMVMHDANENGQRTGWGHTGTFIEVEPTHRLAFTWCSPFTGPHPSTVTLELNEQEGITSLTLIHEGLPPDMVDSHRQGWIDFTELLAAFLVRSIEAIVEKIVEKKKQLLENRSSSKR